MVTTRKHGLQLNIASNKTEAVVDFRGKGATAGFGRPFAGVPCGGWPADANG